MGSETKKKSCQSRLTILLDVGAVLTCGAGGHKAVSDSVALTRICIVHIRTNVVLGGAQCILRKKALIIKFIMGGVGAYVRCCIRLM